MSGEDIAIIAVFCTAIVGMLLRPVFTAWARRIGVDAGDPGLADEVAQLRERVAELEMSGARVAELEERVDFAERMLVQRSEPGQLPVGRLPQ